MASSTVENYLKRLYLEERPDGGVMVPMGRLAAAMGVVPGTATSMVKALADSGLVEYEPRAGVKLTSRGRQLALHVLRRHRLVELFLVKILGLDWSEVHDEADVLEHAISDRVLDRIDALLDYPTADPHGDPIPSSKGHLEEPNRRSLADCALAVQLRVARVLDQDAAFLRFVEKHGLMPGALLTVESREPAAESVIVHIHRHGNVSLGFVAAAKILVGAGDWTLRGPIVMEPSTDRLRGVMTTSDGNRTVKGRAVKRLKGRKGIKGRESLMRSLSELMTRDPLALTTP